MTFDSGAREFSGLPFEYVADPTIEYAAAGNQGQLKTPKGIPAGGVKITVIGANFEAIRQPQIYVYYQVSVILFSFPKIFNKFF